MTDAPTSEKITVQELVLNPRWAWGTLDFPQVNFLSVEHPTHGKMFFALPDEVLAQLITGLAGLSQKGPKQ